MPIPQGFDWKHPDYKAVFEARIAALERIRGEARENKQAIPALKAFYKDNPVAFINDWGMTFDPRNAEVGLPTDIPFLLFPKQEEFVNWTVDLWRNRKNGMAEKSRDMGASWLVVAIAVWVIVFYPGTIVGFGSRKEEYVDDGANMKAIFPKIRFFMERLPREFRPAGYDSKKHATYMNIVNPDNGAAIIGEAGDNIGRGARASIYFVDEAAYLERPAKVEAALSQTTNCRIDVSTVNGEDNPFAQKKFAGKIPCFTLHWKDHPAKDDAWYRAQVEKIDDPVIIAQELDIDYMASSTNQFITGNLVDEAMGQDSSKLKPIGPLKMAVDVARGGGNKSVIALRQGRVCFWIRERDLHDSIEVSDWVISECAALPKLPDQIAVDVIGVGSGVYDTIRAKYPERAYAVNSSGKFDEPPLVEGDGRRPYNMRARMWQGLRAWLKDGPVSMPKELKTKTQITAPRYKYRNELLLIESKEEMLKRDIESPDRADALAMTFAKDCDEIRERTERRERNWRTA